MSAVANLVDIFLVFIVALLMSFLTAYHLEELLSRDSEVTVLKRTPEGEMTVITKRGTEIQATKISRSEAEGRGTRLGVAYQLEDGTMIYLPDDEGRQ
jgi:hypothetical protein